MVFKCAVVLVSLRVCIRVPPEECVYVAVYMYKFVCINCIHMISYKTYRLMYYRSWLHNPEVHRAGNQEGREQCSC